MEVKDIDARAAEELRLFMATHDYGEMPKNEMKYLEKASVAIEKRKDRLSYALKMLSDNAISLSAMVSDEVCSQGTIQHRSSHGALRDYVKEQALAHNVRLESTVADSTMNELKDLRRKMDTVIDRDAELYDAKKTIEELRCEIVRLQNEIKSEVDEVRRGVKSKNGEIIDKALRRVIEQSFNDLFLPSASNN